MKLFERFDKAFLINLPDRKDRLNNFRNEVEKYDLGNFEIVEAVRGAYDLNGISRGNVGLIKSNLKIFETLKADIETILIMEDDCIFTDEVKNIEEYFKHLPTDWEMLYMGGNHNIHAGIKPPTIINEKVCKLHSTFTTHFVAIRKSLFNEIHEFLKNPNSPIDVFYTSLQKKNNVYSFYPVIAKQVNGYSDIEMRNVDYSWLIK